jgi:Ca2+-binding EF-hand superfamily protein
MKRLHKSIVAALLSGTSLLVAAQGPTYPQRGPAPFDAFDRDCNNSITVDEFNALHNERRAARAAAGEPMRNAATAPAFKQIDRNADGVLSRDEMSTFRQQRMSQRSYGRGPGMGSGRGRGRGRNMPTFTEFDLDGDGVMTRDEYIDARNQRISERVKQGYRMRGLKNTRPFADIDLNGDGVVNESEFLQMQAQHRQSRFE